MRFAGESGLRNGSADKFEESCCAKASTIGSSTLKSRKTAAISPTLYAASSSSSFRGRLSAGPWDRQAVAVHRQSECSGRTAAEAH